MSPKKIQRVCAKVFDKMIREVAARCGKIGYILVAAANSNVNPLSICSNCLRQF